MLRRKVIAVVLGIGVSVWAMPAAGQTGGHGHEGQGQGKAATEKESVHLAGEIVDVVCYTKMDASGPKHVKCAEACAKQGASLGLLETVSGQVYLIFPEGHDAPNEKAMPYIGKQVEVVGKLHAKGGLRGIAVEKISEKQDVRVSLPRPR